MYEKITSQSLPSSEYRELLGTALSVFLSNNAFIIENILNVNKSYNWHELVDWESGRLKGVISATITKKCNNTDIADLFSDIVEMRNRIIHGFQITSKQDEQILATKTKISDGNKQFEITEDYLIEFIKKNDRLSNLLHAFRGC